LVSDQAAHTTPALIVRDTRVYLKPERSLHLAILLCVCGSLRKINQVHEAESDTTRTLQDIILSCLPNRKREREKGERERELTWVIQQSVVEIRRACYRIDHLLMWRGVNPGSRCARLWSGGTPSPPCRQLAPVMSGSRGLASSDAAAASRITDYTPFMSALANRREPSPIRALQPMLQIPGMVRLLRASAASLEPSKALSRTWDVCLPALCHSCQVPRADMRGSAPYSRGGGPGVHIVGAAGVAAIWCE
jgi:hypothetical protein